MKVQIYQHDYLLNYIRNEQELSDLFRDGYINEGCSDVLEISPELYERYVKAKAEFFEIDKLLSELVTSNKG